MSTVIKIIKTVIGYEDTLIHKAETMFSNTFTCNQADEIKKGVICFQILLEIHLT